MGPYEYGQVKAHTYHGLGPAEIAAIMLRPDGSQWNQQAIANAIKKTKSKKFQGERKAGSGAPRKTSKATDRAIVREVCQKRGRKKVTVGILKRKFRELRPLGNTLVEERLHDAGLKYLRRRGKTLVAEKHIPSRIGYCSWVKHQTDEYLRRFMYTDGTTWFLDETEEEAEQSERRALGPMVWRRADGKDGLHPDAIGACKYGKSQGVPVKVWGLLAEGKFWIHVLPVRQNMDSLYYAELIEDWIDERRGGCDLLVQDFERCLRSEAPRVAMHTVGIQLLVRYPKVSQDLNPVENCWNLLRDRLYETQPTGRESRDAFIVRLRTAVAWLNRKHAHTLFQMSMSQKKRAQEVLNLKGSRTKW